MSTDSSRQGEQSQAQPRRGSAQTRLMRSREPAATAARVTRAPGKRPDHAKLPHQPSNWLDHATGIIRHGTLGDEKFESIKEIYDHNVLTVAVRERIGKMVMEAAEHTHLICLLQFLGFDQADCAMVEHSDETFDSKESAEREWDAASTAFARAYKNCFDCTPADFTERNAVQNPATPGSWNSVSTHSRHHSQVGWSNPQTEC